MIGSWTIHFVNKTAEEEIFDLTPDLKAKFLHISDLLISFGPQYIGLPHVRPLEKKL